MFNNEFEKIKMSRYISMLLRHKPYVAGLTLDEHGWADVNELVAGVCKTRYLTMAMLEEIVATDEKQRYSFNDDKTQIRANQGHSVNVDVELEEAVPPEFLWHGTGEKSVLSIDKNGLVSKSRLYVHLSKDYETAANVGSRHGRAVVYRIDAKKMHKDGFRFYKSVNNVWLIKYVPVNYIKKER